MPHRRMRMEHPSLYRLAGLSQLAPGVGLAGVYALLGLVAGLAAPALAGPLTVYQGLALLVLGYGLYRLPGKRSRGMALAVLAAAVAKPVAGLLGAGEAAQLLGELVLLASAGLALHHASRLPGLHPALAARLDRMGGLVVLSSFAVLTRLPLVVGLALAVSAAVLLQAYLLLARVGRAAEARARTIGARGRA